MGLNRPLHVQYLSYMAAALRGDLGRSLQTNVPVMEQILNRLPWTIELAAAALLIASVIGITVGIIAALKHNTIIDTLAMALALVGMPGAGKTVCAEALAARGYFTIRFGAVVVDEVRRRGWALKPANEAIVREALRAEHGMAAMAELSLPKLQAALAAGKNIIIDGLYSLSEYKLLRAQLGAPLLLVAIVAPRHLRYRRLAARPVLPLTASEAQERALREIERLEKGGPIAMADYTLLNDATAAALLARLDALLAELDFRPELSRELYKTLAKRNPSRL